MLTQIKKIKNFGVFGEYVAAANFPSFGRYNVIYGENGSGKTTLSRLLACLEAGEHPEHPDLEYTVESQSGQLVRGTKYLSCGFRDDRAQHSGMMAITVPM